MAYDFSFLWVWLILALIIGGVTGWMTYAKGPQERWLVGWPVFALIVFVVGLVVAWLHWLPGRAGFWLETALFFFASYVVGCLVGGWLKSPTPPQTAPAVAPTAPTRAVEAGPPAATATAAEPKPVVETAAQPPIEASPVGVAADAAPPTPAVKPAVEPPIEAEPAAASATAPAPTPAAAPATSAPSPAPAAASSEPAAMGPVPGEEKHPGARPLGLVAARGGKADDLQLIKGIGPQNERRLNALGVWHFAQIAAWTHDNALWIGSYLAFAGRIEREQWIAQARTLAEGGETAFAARVARGEVAGKTDQAPHGAPGAADRPKA
jgi:predicted flap endonuclease-1-like 5' DNA nuclease